jgi:hypothetical protein
MTFDTILGIIGVGIGIIGIITGFVFYKKSEKHKSPVYFMKSNNLIQDNRYKLNGLDISYKGQKITNLTITEIAFWNQGREVIERDDIVKSELLRIETLEGIEILDAQIIRFNNSTSGVTIEQKNPQRVNLSFDYLEKDNGVTVQIIHTGKETGNIFINGKIKGAEIREHSIKRPIIFAYVFLILFSFLIVTSIFSFYMDIVLIRNNILFFLLFLFAPFSFYFMLERIFGFRKGIPKGLFSSSFLDKNS